MTCLLYNKDPLFIVNNMGSYFKQVPPDCALFSEDGFEIPVHKELLYQTRFLRRMLKSANMDNFKIEIMIPSISKAELGNMINFLYTGKIYCPDQTFANQVFDNLTELFGFPSRNFDFNGTILKNESQDESKDQYQEPDNDLRSVYDDDCNVLDLDENESKIEEFDQTPLKENGLIIPRLTKKPKKSSLIIKPLSEMTKTQENEKNSLVCHICNKQSTSRSSLNEHIRVIHNGEPRKVLWKCKLCENSFLKAQQLRRHLNKAHDRDSKRFPGSKQNQKWACCLCKPKNDTFQRELPLIEHLQTVHDVKYECKICDTLFTHNLKLTRHFKFKHPEVENPFECSECQLTFQGGDSLNEHISIVHKGKEKEKPHLCQTCGKSFEKASLLEKHVKTVHDKLGYQCKHCDEKFQSPNTMYAHIALKHEGKTFDCNICDRTFATKHRLKLHTENMHSDKPKERFQCPKCEKTCSKKEYLERHIERVHEGKIHQFQCLHCQKIFTCERGMKLHIQYNHEGKKKNKCPFCPKEFEGKARLQGHIEGVHEKKYPYLCTLCGKHFQQNAGLKHHNDTKHSNKYANEVFQCQFCDKSFDHPSKIKNHMKYNHEQKKSKLPCPYGCKGTFVMLQKHIEFVHEKKNIEFVCKFCNKVLTSKANLKTHVRIVHEGARPFGCELCGKTFTTKQHRDIHVKRDHESMKQEIT